MYELTEQQANFIASLLANSQVCALFRSPKDKAVAASLQMLTPKKEAAEKEAVG